MSIIKQISSSIKTKKMSLEEKICYLEKLQKDNVDISTLPISYISKDGIIINNVLINIRKYFFKRAMSVKQIIRCENLGINLNAPDEDIEYKINFLKKAIEEGYVLQEIINNPDKYEKNSVYKYIIEIRKAYEEDKLKKSQIDECIDFLRIIIPKEQRKDIALKIIRESAIKNVINSKEIVSSLN